MLDKRPLPQIIADKIIDLIESKELLPGEKLPSEQELMKELNVGRGTIREAIKSLVSRNIVEIRRGVGTFVAKNTGVVEDPLGFSFINNKKKLVKDSMDVRLLLEPSIARWAARNATDSEILEIIELSKRIEKAILNDEDYSDLDVEFHTKIANSSRNLVIENLIPILNMNIRSLIDVTHAVLKEHTILSHKKIANAIKERDEEMAERLMREHIEINQNYLDEPFRLIQYNQTKIMI